ncbi:acylglycerol kinase, mitochondrial [Hemicordylus capensis]|uniref:acylglycerol kinase, mitochondrial n=1 Tax=Hemicordylus capensis TaxID=884348 RepID=UPI002303F918|nr:acylglycerol kinase, mitochondrial [Hemicordylus capensis]XP_053110746.1 acylglycerol kinase, mitochondrial [Hemicordylus capensis]XP_053110747.1 acylglycerol kinase, mitochondrial [Hemicordylus capensis]XP_053110748.1 acylglycerol kinase, mitochondrial [Hemicordylus capensis]
MARVIKIFQTLRNHWKKTTLGVCLFTWGGNWLYGKHCDNLLRRAACQEAQAFGNQIIPPSMQIKKATVFLNPAACKGKARSLFEKNAAPILHLSGLDVTIVKTDYEGQAKKLLELMENTDMIIIAGGDGTVQEVITGLLRRADEAAFSKIPIGFIPLGKSSTLGHTLYPEKVNQVQFITDATLSILKGETIPLDVLQIKGNKDQPVFALTGLRWGSYRDAGAKVSKYWYLGPLKIKVSHFFSTLKEWPQKHLASLTYVGPTPRPPEEPEQKMSRPPLYIRLYKRLALYWAPTPKEIPKEVTPEAWQEMQLSAIEFSITTQNRHLDLKRTEDFMNICIEPDTISKGEYIKRGSQKMQDPHLCPEGSQCLQASRCILQLPEDTAGSLAIDSEEYEAMPVEVRLLPRKLQFFCDARKKEQMLQSAS